MTATARAHRLLFLTAILLLVANVFVLRSVRNVTVLVNGEPTSIRTFKDSVGDVLASVGVDVGDRDHVSMPLDADVVNDLTIEFVEARPVSVTIDREPITVFAPVMTVAEVVEELALPYAAGDLWLSHALDASLTDETIRIRLPRDVSIAVDGEVQEVTTTVLTVSAALDEAGIELGPEDMVEPALDADLVDGATILVARVENEEITVEESIPFETENRNADDLFRGDSRVVESGANGVRLVTYRVTRVDGEETEREQLSSEVQSEPTTRIVEHGTKEHPPGVNGSDEGLASYYGCGDGFNGRRTASGEIFDHNAMTAAHRTLPFGTIVTVESHRTGKTVQVRINDRGPAAWTGKLIDLSCGAMEVIAGGPDGSHPVTITW